MKNCNLIAASVVVGMTFAVGAKTPTVMNIVNFVRGSEPRYPDRDLVLPLREEIKLNSQYHLPNTILMQYDAMLRDDMVAAAKSAEQDKTEYGVWFELCRQLVEKCGIKWAGRDGWDWEWFVNPGFLMAYETHEREKRIDETFRLFKERFGAYPRVAGSWILDAHSMNYMSEKYGMDGFCICKEHRGHAYPGTGDLFASVLLGELLCGKGFEAACHTAADFTAEVIGETAKTPTPVRNGVALEAHLWKLIPHNS